MALNIPVIEAFLGKHEGKRILLFGFTFMVWQHFIKRWRPAVKKLALGQCAADPRRRLEKLQHEAVSPADFARRLQDVCGLPAVHDYYGMVEQTGCIYMQCEQGHLHASIFSDVIIRDPQNFACAPVGQPGIIQVLSLLPESYPRPRVADGR